MANDMIVMDRPRIGDYQRILIQGRYGTYRIRAISRNATALKGLLQDRIRVIPPAMRAIFPREKTSLGAAQPD